MGEIFVFVDVFSHVVSPLKDLYVRFGASWPDLVLHCQSTLFFERCAGVDGAYRPPGGADEQGPEYSDERDLGLAAQCGPVDAEDFCERFHAPRVLYARASDQITGLIAAR